MTKLKGRSKKFTVRRTKAHKELERRQKILSGYKRVFKIISERREKMAKARRDCGKAEDGRPCSNCNTPSPALPLDQKIQQLLQAEKISVGPKQPFAYPLLMEVPLVEYSRCPFFIINEALFYEVLTGALFRSYLQEDYRQTCKDMAKEAKRAINAIRDCFEPHADSHLFLSQMDIVADKQGGDPVWAMLDYSKKMETELSKLIAGAKSSAGPRGNAVRRSIYITMLRVWKELTGRLPAKNNTTFHDLADAALRIIDPTTSMDYSAEAATNTAIEAYLKGN